MHERTIFQTPTKQKNYKLVEKSSFSNKIIDLYDYSQQSKSQKQSTQHSYKKQDQKSQRKRILLKSNKKNQFNYTDKKHLLQKESPKLFQRYQQKNSLSKIDQEISEQYSSFGTVRKNLFHQKNESYQQNNSQFKINQQNFIEQQFKSPVKDARTSLRKGLSLLKNIIEKQKIIKQAQQDKEIQTLNSSAKAKAKSKKLKQFYLQKYSFYRAIQNYAQKGQISKYKFSLILLKEKLIDDIVNDRHLINRIWRQISLITQQQDNQDIQIRYIFTFLISILQHPLQQIRLFQQIQNEYDRPGSQECRQINLIMIKIYHHFSQASAQFKLKKLRAPLNKSCRHQQHSH